MRFFSYKWSSHNISGLVMMHTGRGVNWSRCTLVTMYTGHDVHCKIDIAICGSVILIGYCK